MKNKHILLLSSVVLTACSGLTDTKNPNVNLPEGTVNTLNFSYMDTSVNPSVDFYQYANGNWVKNNPVPDSKTKIGSFDEVQDRNNEVLKEILTEISSSKNEPGTEEQLVGDFYFTFSNSDQRNSDGYKAIEPFMKKIEAMQSIEEMHVVLAELHNYGIGGFFEAGVEQDLKVNTKHSVYLGQGGISLPDKDYYTKTDDASKNIQSAYRAYIQDMFKLAGLTKTEEEVAQIYELEYSLAMLSMNSTELRNIALMYNPMNYSDFKEKFPKFKWDEYFKLRGYSSFDTLIAMQPKFIEGFISVAKTYGQEKVKNYLQFKVLNSLGSVMTTDMEAMQFAFYGTKIAGQKKQKEMLERGIDKLTGNELGEALGHLFVNKSFSPEAKAKVNEMVDNLTIVYRKRIKDLGWMSDETKEKAIEKMNAFTRKLGYPDKWKSYEGLTITRNSYAQNSLMLDKYTITKNTKKLNEPIDKTKWGMPPHMVNAYYNPLQTEIVFPAGIMQPPFFDENVEDAVNYARMGAVIGHEFTHGFDDQGAQFNAAGQFENWWTEADMVQFNERTNKLVNQFNGFEALPGLYVNGRLTLGENIADFGGLTIAYYAWKESQKGKPQVAVKGFSPEQRFFLAFAQIWKSNYTDAAMNLQVNTNPHSPGKYRVNGPLSNMPEFFEAFDIPEGSPMRQNEDNIAVIW